MWIVALAIICGTGIFICEGSAIIDAVSNYKKKKLEEEHKTTNLALVYQILSARPELSLEEVMTMIDSNSSAVKQLVQQDMNQHS